MIRMDEILKGIRIDTLPVEHQNNLQTLLHRINLVRSRYNKPMIVTSGYRTKQKHLDIYAKMGITDERMIPMKSKHLDGSAIDIYDPDAVLYKWCKANEDFLRRVGLWLEHRQGPWVHFQSKPFGSYKPGGSIWFNP
jgi:uncharacterized protein YcbK (DUF882 family)